MYLKSEDSRFVFNRYPYTVRCFWSLQSLITAQQTATVRMLVHYDGTDIKQAQAQTSKQEILFTYSGECRGRRPRIAVIVMMKTRTSLIIILWILFANCVARSKFSSSDFLSLGDSFLASEDIFGAIEHYKRAISLLDGSDSPVVVISLYTNLGTALSSIGKNPEAADSYKAAIMVHSEATEVSSPAEENEGDIVSMRELGDIAAQASFYLGMVLQDMGDFNKAAKAYSYAGILDPYHWASFSNLGALLQDEFRDYSGAIVAYSKAYDILTQLDVEPTDAPFEPRYIVSQLKYRIGMVRLFSSSNDKIQRIIIRTTRVLIGSPMTNFGDMYNIFFYFCHFIPVHKGSYFQS